MNEVDEFRAPTLSYSLVALLFTITERYKYLDVIACQHRFLQEVQIPLLKEFIQVWERKR
jgi:hypothetical protein